MNDYIKIIIQAIIQGLTEFLPVSSSGHLTAVQHFMDVGEESAFIIIFLHLGTLLAVFIAFRETVFGMIKEFFLTIFDILTGKFSWRRMNGNRRMMFMVVIATLLLVPVYPFREYFEIKNIILLGGAFVLTSVILFFADSCVKGIKKPEDIKLTDALIVGFFQVIALFPGVSRSGSTISAGLFRGLSRKTTVTYSFMLGIPAILGASLSAFLDLVESPEVFADGGVNKLALAIGFIVSLLVGLFSIKLVKLLIKKEKFKIFAIYTLIVGSACVIWGAFEMITGTSIRF